MTTLSFRVYGFPVAQGRPRLTTIGGHARAYDPGKSRDWKRTVHSEASKIVEATPGLYPLQGPLSMALVFHLLRPKTLPKRITKHVKRPDCDNLAKAVKDACSGCLYRDDAQVFELVVKKQYSEQPGVEISIMECAG